MQALWLVCTGFRKFRHTDYCTTLRKQPDFPEPEKQPVYIGDPKDQYESKNWALSNKFAQTMSPVWEQQKVADANSMDGDVDMEKGFVNNVAPWGVDPVSSGGEKKKEEYTSEQMQSRLSFLIDAGGAPERVASPIQGFISALQESDEVAQKSLVSALVDMDRDEGEKQSSEDQRWYEIMIDGMSQQDSIADSQDTEMKLQADRHTDIQNLHDLMADNQVERIKLEKEHYKQ